jgi:hypothetical protein
MTQTDQAPDQPRRARRRTSSARGGFDPVAALNAAVAVKAKIAAMTDDRDVIRDTLEGETDLAKILDVLADNLGEAAALEEATKSRIDDLTKRRSALERRQDTIRALILEALETASLDTYVSPVATLSVRPLERSVLITAEHDLPTKFLVEQKMKPDKRAIKEALSGGLKVPGAQLTNGGSCLVVTVS